MDISSVTIEGKRRRGPVLGSYRGMDISSDTIEGKRRTVQMKTRLEDGLDRRENEGRVIQRQ